jgi:hypothetical protein
MESLLSLSLSLLFIIAWLANNRDHREDLILSMWVTAYTTHVISLSSFSLLDNRAFGFFFYNKG